jgi:hypothetical protein
MWRKMTSVGRLSQWASHWVDEWMAAFAGHQLENQGARWVRTAAMMPIPASRLSLLKTTMTGAINPDAKQEHRRHGASRPGAGHLAIRQLGMIARGTNTGPPANGMGPQGSDIQIEVKRWRRC